MANARCVTKQVPGHLTETGLRFSKHLKRSKTMLYWTLVFLVVALIAGALGFSGVAGAAAGLAKILFFVFLVLFVLSLISGAVRRPV